MVSVATYSQMKCLLHHRHTDLAAHICFHVLKQDATLAFRPLRKQKPMDSGKHVTQLEQKTTYDRVRKKWTEKVSGISKHQPYTITTTAEREENQPLNELERQIHSGWALKVHKKVMVMSPNVKAYLIDQLNVGVRTVYKLDSKSVAREMKTKMSEGKFVFSPSEWRTEKQISSLFSRLAAAQRKQVAEGTATSTDDEEVHDEDDVVSWEVTGQEEDIRQTVYTNIDICHPVMCADINVCRLIAQSKWKTMKIRDLKGILRDVKAK